MAVNHDLLIPIFGLAGDTLTFAGGLILVSDAIRQENHFRQMKKLASTLSSPQLVRLKVDVDDIVVADQDDVELAFMRRSARKAVRGTIVLVCGFGFLLAHRALDIGARFLSNR